MCLPVSLEQIKEGIFTELKYFSSFANWSESIKAGRLLVKRELGTYKGVGAKCPRLLQRLRNDLSHILGKSWSGLNPFQLRAHQFLTGFVIAPPADQ